MSFPNRKLCKLSHDVSSQHNAGLLRECTLHHLQEDELFLLLLQNDPQLLPEVTSTPAQVAHTGQRRGYGGIFLP